MHEPPVIEYLPPEIIKFEYSGEQTQHCAGCNEDIEEGDMVVLERFKYNGKLMADKWHPDCWEDADVSVIEVVGKE
jgi:hypothetical protein